MEISCWLKLLLLRLSWLDALAIVAAYLLCHSFRYARHRGPLVWPIVGMLPQVSSNFKRGYDWVTTVLESTGGTFEFVVPWVPSLNAVVTCDPQNIEHILKTNFANFPKGRALRSGFKDLLGDGIFNSDQSLWLSQRKISSLHFYAKGFRDLSCRSISSLVSERLLPILDASADSGTLIDLQDVLLRFTFDNICILALGTDPCCLRQELPRVPFAKAFDVATTLTLLRFTVPEFYWRLQRFFNIRRERKLGEAIATVHSFAAAAIQKRRQEFHKKSSTAAAGEDLITCFLSQQGKQFSDEFLRDVAVNFILAGRDTSSVALAWFFWLLQKNPKVEKEILRELTSIDARRNQEEQPDGGCYGFDEIKQMHYLHAAITESLRLYPSVPIDNKEIVEDDVLPDGTKLRRGGRILYSIYSMGRMEGIWGQDAREFRPERWLKNRVFVPESAFKYTAFNAGPRLCLGRDVAYLQMKAIASSILKRYSVRVLPGHIVKQKLSLTLFMRNGLPVTLQRRS